MSKRLMDILVSLLVLAVGYPLMIILAMIVRADSPGPVIFRQRRAGYRGKCFLMLKFRTMRTDTNPYGVSPAAASDDRLTASGRWLRETSLDELPQLFNVLNGTMSLVGPRPLYERQALLWDDRQRRRLEVLPGITGWAQVGGRADLPIEDKIELDLWYVENRSLALDLRILWRTFRNALVRGDTIYERQYSRAQVREQF
jgi:lipopolysaccharide/colanic/teichoic acid biosynthesis glycosyltransferase